MSKPTPRSAASVKSKAKTTSSASDQQGFSYTRSHFEGLVDAALKHAKKLGATDAGAEASEGCGLSVSVRKGELENVERNRDKSLGVTVYVGQRRGNASTSDFSQQAIEQTVQAAYDIARFTAEDPFASLPDEADIAQPHEQRTDLDLFKPWDINAAQAAEIARQTEAAALGVDAGITNSEGASVSAQQSHFFSAHTHGFRGGYASSRHSVSVSPIAGSGDDMQRDYWYSSHRYPEDLAAPAAIGRYAAERALSRLNARKIPTTQCAVLFESPLAAGLLGALVHVVGNRSHIVEKLRVNRPFVVLIPNSFSDQKRTTLGHGVLKSELMFARNHIGEPFVMSAVVIGGRRSRIAVVLDGIQADVFREVLHQTGRQNRQVASGGGVPGFGQALRVFIARAVHAKCLGLSVHHFDKMFAGAANAFGQCHGCIVA